MYIKYIRNSIIGSLTLLCAYSCSKSDKSPEEETKPVVTTPTTTEIGPPNYNWRDTSITDLMAYSNGSTYSTKTPMGVNFENKHITTDSDIKWLSDATNEPPVQTSVASTHWATFKVDLWATYGKPDPVHVNQHIIGDCNGLAAFACMAYASPDFVKSLIKDNGDNTYTISMYDPQGKPINVVVSSQFLAEDNGKLAACGAQGSNVATWATVLEKAIMKYNYIYKFWSNGTDIGGIGSEHTTPLFTGQGNSFAFASSKLSPTNLRRVVRWALANGKFVTGGWLHAGIVVGEDESVTGHAYTLMVSTDSSALFAMRNPWGFNPSSSGGTNMDNGMVHVPNVGSIVSEIDVRIIDPGAAGDKGTNTPYEKPKL